MPYGEFAKCPCNDRGCTTPIAHGKEEIEKLLVTVIWVMEK